MLALLLCMCKQMLRESIVHCRAMGQSHIKTLSRRLQQYSGLMGRSSEVGIWQRHLTTLASIDNAFCVSSTPAMYRCLDKLWQVQFSESPRKHLSCLHRIHYHCEPGREALNGQMGKCWRRWWRRPIWWRRQVQSLLLHIRLLPFSYMAPLSCCLRQALWGGLGAACDAMGM